MLRLWPSSCSGAASVSCDAIRVSRGSPVRSLDAVTKLMSSTRVHAPVIARSYLFLAWLVCLSLLISCAWLVCLSILISCAFAALLLNLPFTSSLICFAGFFPGICCSGMSFQLTDPDAKIPKFKTGVATAGMTYFFELLALAANLHVIFQR